MDTDLDREIEDLRLWSMTDLECPFCDIDARLDRLLLGQILYFDPSFLVGAIASRSALGTSWSRDSGAFPRTRRKLGWSASQGKRRFLLGVGHNRRPARVASVRRPHPPPGEPGLQRAFGALPVVRRTRPPGPVTPTLRESRRVREVGADALVV